MRADNSHHLVAAAKERSRSTREKATRALRRLDATGRPITIETVAREAGVSRSWLCSQPDLRTEIDKLRASARTTPALRYSANCAHSDEPATSDQQPGPAIAPVAGPWHRASAIRFEHDQRRRSSTRKAGRASPGPSGLLCD
ncbi:DUF6262 family protein [Nonomuraea antimicrobica]|uniref:DUF6262 family protein n=1 Tax=Nonomuraea antimicrobica TaxID=561173 RepID=UPI003CD058E9